MTNRVVPVFDSKVEGSSGGNTNFDQDVTNSDQYVTNSNDPDRVFQQEMVRLYVTEELLEGGIPTLIVLSVNDTDIHNSSDGLNSNFIRGLHSFRLAVSFGMKVSLLIVVDDEQSDSRRDLKVDAKHDPKSKDHDKGKEKEYVDRKIKDDGKQLHRILEKCRQFLLQELPDSLLVKKYPRGIFAIGFDIYVCRRCDIIVVPVLLKRVGGTEWFDGAPLWLSDALPGRLVGPSGGSSVGARGVRIVPDSDGRNSETDQQTDTNSCHAATLSHGYTLQVELTVKKWWTGDSLLNSGVGIRSDFADSGVFHKHAVEFFTENASHEALKFSSTYHLDLSFALTVEKGFDRSVIGSRMSAQDIPFVNDVVNFYQSALFTLKDFKDGARHEKLFTLKDGARHEKQEGKQEEGHEQVRHGLKSIKQSAGAMSVHEQVERVITNAHNQQNTDDDKKIITRIQAVHLVGAHVDEAVIESPSGGFHAMSLSIGGNERGRNEKDKRFESQGVPMQSMVFNHDEAAPHDKASRSEMLNDYVESIGLICLDESIGKSVRKFIEGILHPHHVDRTGGIGGDSLDEKTMGIQIPSEIEYDIDLRAGTLANDVLEAIFSREILESVLGVAGLGVTRIAENPEHSVGDSRVFASGIENLGVRSKTATNAGPSLLSVTSERKYAVHKPLVNLTTDAARINAYTGGFLIIFPSIIGLHYDVRLQCVCMAWCYYLSSAAAVRSMILPGLDWGRGGKSNAVVNSGTKALVDRLQRVSAARAYISGSIVSSAVVAISGIVMSSLPTPVVLSSHCPTISLLETFITLEESSFRHRVKILGGVVGMFGYFVLGALPLGEYEVQEAEGALIKRLQAANNTNTQEDPLKVVWYLGPTLIPIIVVITLMTSGILLNCRWIIAHRKQEIQAQEIGQGGRNIGSRCPRLIPNLSKFDERLEDILKRWRESDFQNSACLAGTAAGVNHSSTEGHIVGAANSSQTGASSTGFGLKDAISVVIDFQHSYLKKQIKWTMLVGIFLSMVWVSVGVLLNIAVIISQDMPFAGACVTSMMFALVESLSVCFVDEVYVLMVFQDHCKHTNRQMQSKWVLKRRTLWKRVLSNATSRRMQNLSTVGCNVIGNAVANSAFDGEVSKQARIVFSNDGLVFNNNVGGNTNPTNPRCPLILSSARSFEYADQYRDVDNRTTSKNSRSSENSRESNSRARKIGKHNAPIEGDHRSSHHIQENELTEGNHCVQGVGNEFSNDINSDDPHANDRYVDLNESDDDPEEIFLRRFCDDNHLLSTEMQQKIIGVASLSRNSSRSDVDDDYYYGGAWHITGDQKRVVMLFLIGIHTWCETGRLVTAMCQSCLESTEFSMAQRAESAAVFNTHNVSTGENPQEVFPTSPPQETFSTLFFGNAMVTVFLSFLGNSFNRLGYNRMMMRKLFPCYPWFFCPSVFTKVFDDCRYAAGWIKFPLVFGVFFGRGIVSGNWAISNNTNPPKNEIGNNPRGYYPGYGTDMWCFNARALACVVLFAIGELLEDAFVLYMSSKDAKKFNLKFPTSESNRLQLEAERRPKGLHKGMMNLMKTLNRLTLHRMLSPRWSQRNSNGRSTVDRTLSDANWKRSSINRLTNFQGPTLHDSFLSVQLKAQRRSTERVTPRSSQSWSRRLKTGASSVSSPDVSQQFGAESSLSRSHGKVTQRSILNPFHPWVLFTKGRDRLRLSNRSLHNSGYRYGPQFQNTLRSDLTFLEVGFVTTTSASLLTGLLLSAMGRAALIGIETPVDGQTHLVENLIQLFVWANVDYHKMK